MWFRRRRRLETVFFDIGGVVVDAPMDNYGPLGAEAFGCPVTLLERLAADHLPHLERGAITSEVFWQRMCDSVRLSGLSDEEVQPWRFKGFWESVLLESMTLHHSVIRMCKALKASVGVAALSNTIEEHASALQRLGVYEPFSPLILSCRVGSRKPEPEIYKEACRLAKTEPGRSLFIDDLEINCQAAEKLGFAVHLFTDAPTLERDLRSRGLL